MRVSVLLPARDAASTLDVAVASVRAQTLGDFELLLIDDGSKDATPVRCAAHAHADPRVRVVTTPGLGLVRALNLGLRLARAPLVARMDADDETLPTRLQRSVEALDTDPTLSGVGTGVEIFRVDRPVSPNLQAYGRWLSSLTTPELLFRDRLIESPLCHPSVLLRRAALEQVGGWSDGPYPEDWELWLRLLERGHRLRCLPEVLHRWRDHDSRLTRTDARYAHARHLDLKAEVLAAHFAGRPLVLCGATDTGRGLSKRLSERGARVVGFVELDPRKIGQRIHGVPVVAPQAIDSLGPAVAVCCVAAKGGREALRAWLDATGRVEGVDYVVVA